MKPSEKTDEMFYVGFSDAATLRRSVLETARAVVQTVHMHHRIRELQDEKLKLRTDLAHLVHEIREDLHKLEHALPKRDVTAHAPAPVQRAAPRRVADHRLDKIEAALAEIEQRMRSV
jgi:hypothetical protein